MKVDLPLYIDIPRKTKKDRRVRVSLNVYRNLHYMVSNQAKKLFKQHIEQQVLALPKMKVITVAYRFYPATKALSDTSNMCCIADKFFLDALVELGKLPDDNYNNVPEVCYRFGGIDKENPRVEATITKIIS